MYLFWNVGATSGHIVRYYSTLNPSAVCKSNLFTNHTRNGQYVALPGTLIAYIEKEMTPNENVCRTNYSTA